MALNLAQKEVIVAHVSEVANNSVSVVAALNKGMKVSEFNELRTKARQAGVHLKVIRNTLARRGFQGTQFECVSESLVGPVVLGFSKTEPGGAAKLFNEFVKNRPSVEVKALAVGSQFFSANQLEAVASLPTRDEAFAQLARALNTPATMLARLLSEPSTKLARALNALKDKPSA